MDSIHVSALSPPDDGMGEEGEPEEYTINALIITNIDGIIIGKGRGVPDTHDMGAIKQGMPDLGRWTNSMKDPNTPQNERIIILADSGYGGLHKYLQGADVVTPLKRPRGGKLTKEQIMHNKNLAKMRSEAECAIRELRQYAIMRGPYRNSLDEFDQDLNITGGLVNMKKMMRTGTYDKWMQWLNKTRNRSSPPPT